jgi:ATP-dependent Clp protease ATP-binding subunit ClpB
MIRILCRRTKNNPVLIGEPGVGKSAIAEGLAQRIVARDVPTSLFGKVYSLDMGALMAGAKYKGEYEERIKGVMNDVEKAAQQGDGIILFIDEMRTSLVFLLFVLFLHLVFFSVLTFLAPRHTTVDLIMAGSGSSSGGMDAANLLKPALARGKVRVLDILFLPSSFTCT